MSHVNSQAPHLILVVLDALRMISSPVHLLVYTFWCFQYTFAKVEHMHLYSDITVVTWSPVLSFMYLHFGHISIGSSNISRTSFTYERSAFA